MTISVMYRKIQLSSLLKFYCLLIQIDLLPEMSMAPRILSGIDGALKAKQLKADIDKYIKVIGKHS